MNRFLFILAILPSIIILTIIYKKDVDKESRKLLSKLFFMGILSCFLTLAFSFFSEKVFPFFNIEFVNSNSKNYILLFSYSFFQVGFIEELSKWIIVYFISWNNKEFNHMYDAIVYAVFVSLGFATFENILYVFEYGVFTAILRGILSVPGHAVFGVMMGYYLGLAKFNFGTNKDIIVLKNKILSIFIPTLLHGLFDFCVLSSNGYLYIFFICFVLFLYIISIKKINKISNVV